jgi:hypothetical protein
VMLELTGLRRRDEMAPLKWDYREKLDQPAAGWPPVPQCTVTPSFVHNPHRVPNSVPETTGDSQRKARGYMAPSLQRPSASGVSRELVVVGTYSVIITVGVCDQCGAHVVRGLAHPWCAPDVWSGADSSVPSVVSPVWFFLYAVDNLDTWRRLKPRSDSPASHTYPR